MAPSVNTTKFSDILQTGIIEQSVNGRIENVFAPCPIPSHLPEWDMIASGFHIPQTCLAAFRTSDKFVIEIGIRHLSCPKLLAELSALYMLEALLGTSALVSSCHTACCSTACAMIHGFTFISSPNGRWNARPLLSQQSYRRNPIPKSACGVRFSCPFAIRPTPYDS